MFYSAVSFECDDSLKEDMFNESIKKDLLMATVQFRRDYLRQLKFTIEVAHRK